VIAQAATADTHEVKDPNEIPRWQELCGQMRDAAGEVNAAVRAGDRAAVDAAMKRLTQSCDDCHKTFRVETTE
jgi:cytochrome c556